MKQINFVVECVVRNSEKISDDEVKLSTLFIVRLTNGQIVKIFDNEVELIDFFSDSMNKLADISEGK